MESGDRKPAILVVNAGSSSVKFELSVEGAAGWRPRIRGMLDGVGVCPRLEWRLEGGEGKREHRYDAASVSSVERALEIAFDTVAPALGGDRLIGIGHRIVHGGPEFAEPVRIDASTRAALERFVPLAPLHQPSGLAGIDVASKRFAGVPQVACFDTAFHRRHPEIADLFAIPYRFYEEGVRRYGFHGLSYEAVTGRLRQRDPELARGRVVIAHLGSGCSLCAVDDGRPVETTMAFTPLDGVPMGTRPGQLDPGVLLYLLEEKGYDVPRLVRLLYHESGLLGLSGISNDVRILLARSTDPGAQRALAYFEHRVARETAALAAALGGIDGMVFTAGIGENAAPVRKAILRRLAFLGFRLDEEANERHGPVLTRAGSKARALVIPTDEETVILEHVRRLLDVP